MTPERWHAITEVFHAALAYDDDVRRADFVAHACGGDEALAADVRGMLDWHVRAESSEPRLVVPVSHLSLLDQGDTLGRYRIEALIGSGGMGEVYRAHDPDLTREIAIKVLFSSPAGEERARLMREARAIAALNHHNICTVHDIGSDRGIDYIVMEYLGGGTLASRIADGPLPIDETMRYAADVAGAIAAAHQQGITHRDLKPSNIMFSAVGAKLLDFGIARSRTSNDSVTSDGVTFEGALVGTPRYMAPEVVAGADADARSDVFAFGVVLYEMLTGHPPFTGESPNQLAAAILLREPAPLRTIRRDVPRGLEDLVTRCLRKDPTTRCQDGGVLVRELRRMQEGGLQTIALFAERVVRRARPARLAAAGAAAVIVATALVAARWKPAAAVLPPPPHLAALPCEAAPGAADQVLAVCNGLSDVLMTRMVRLTSAHPLQVTPFSESYRRQLRTLDAMRTAIGATHVLSTIVQPSGSQTNLEFRLIDPRSKNPLGADTFVVSASDLFAEQDRLAGWLVRALALDLTHVEREALVTRQTTNAAAYNLFLAGTGATRMGGADALDRAVTALSSATETDPAFAEGFAMLGFAAWRRSQQTHESSLDERALAACDHALVLNLRLARAHACRGLVLHDLGRHVDAVRALERAVDADPTDDDAIVWLGREQEELRDFAATERTFQRAVNERPRYWATHAWLGNFYRRLARHREAADEYEQILSLVPAATRIYAILSVPSMYIGRYDVAIAALQKSVAIEPTREAFVNWGQTLYRMRRFDEAADKLERARAFGEPDYLLLGDLARARYWSGRREEAAQLYGQAIRAASVELTGRVKADIRISLAEFYAKTGQSELARDQLRQAGIKLDEPSRPTDPHVLFFAAIDYYQLGDKSAALAWLERAVYWGVPVAELQAYPELDGLRDEPAFQGLLRRASRSATWRRIR